MPAAAPSNQGTRAEVPITQADCAWTQKAQRTITRLLSARWLRPPFEPAPWVQPERRRRGRR